MHICIHTRIYVSLSVCIYIYMDINSQGPKPGITYRLGALGYGYALAQTRRWSAQVQPSPTTAAGMWGNPRPPRTAGQQAGVEGHGRCLGSVYAYVYTSVHAYMYMYFVYIYIYCLHVYICIYIYICICEVVGVGVP